MKSFEEFHTLQKRKRAWDRLKQKEEFDPPTSKEESKSPSSEKSTNDDKGKSIVVNDNDSVSVSRRSAIGQMIESYETQLFIVALIYLDLITYTITYILENDVGTFSNSEKVEKIVDTDDSTLLRFLSSIMNFTSICFVIEMFGLIFSFGVVNFFTHFGYCLDAFIISTILYDSMSSYNTTMDVLFPVQFLSFLRFWRVARLISTIVSKVEEEHEETKFKLNEIEKEVKTEKMKSYHLQISNSNETDLRKKVERTLQAYKDEVETLKEALKIAALDVTITAREEFQENTHEVLVAGEKEAKIFRKNDGQADGTFIDQNGDEFFDGHETQLKAFN